jgi:hypothetical protein
VFSHRQLLSEELVEFDSPPGRMRARLKCGKVFPRKGMVQIHHGLPERCKLVATHDARGQSFVQALAIQRLPDQAPHGGLSQTGDHRVHRGERLRQRHLASHHLVAGMNHLAAEKPRPQFAKGPQFRSGCKQIGLTRVEMEKPHDSVTA